MAGKRKVLSFNLFRGLYGDIVNGSVEPDTYYFGEYKITIEKQNMNEISNRKIVSNHNLLQQSRYEMLKAKGLCTNCKSPKLKINLNGTKSIRCEACNQKAIPHNLRK